MLSSPVRTTIPQGSQNLQDQLLKEYWVTVTNLDEQLIGKCSVREPKGSADGLIRRNRVRFSIRSWRGRGICVLLAPRSAFEVQELLKTAQHTVVDVLRVLGEYLTPAIRDLDNTPPRATHETSLRHVGDRPMDPTVESPGPTWNHFLPIVVSQRDGTRYRITHLRRSAGVPVLKDRQAWRHESLIVRHNHSRSINSQVHRCISFVPVLPGEPRTDAMAADVVTSLGEIPSRQQPAGRQSGTCLTECVVPKWSPAAHGPRPGEINSEQKESPLTWRFGHHQRASRWSGRQDLNLRPLDPQGYLHNPLTCGNRESPAPDGAVGGS